MTQQHVVALVHCMVEQYYLTSFAMTNQVHILNLKHDFKCQLQAADS